MSAPVGRRGFLRGLTTLPLVGGGVALIGAPSAVAAPVTVPLLEAYSAWLCVEYGETIIELEPLTHPQRDVYPHLLPRMTEWRRQWCFENGTLNPDRHFFLTPPAQLPSTRAALVLSAVGHEWEGRQW